MLGNASLFKMEQRLVRMGVLDRQLLASMTGSAWVEPRGIDPSGMHKRQAQLPPAASGSAASIPPQAQLALGVCVCVA